MNLMIMFNAARKNTFTEREREREREKQKTFTYLLNTTSRNLEDGRNCVYLTSVEVFPVPE